MPNLPKFRLNVAAKAVVLIAGLGVMSVLANWMVLQRLDRLDEINDALINHSSPARLALTEAKIAVTSMGLAVYKMASTGDSFSPENGCPFPIWFSFTMINDLPSGS